MAKRVTKFDPELLDALQAREELHAFASGPWGQKFPMIVDSWKRNWEHVIPFYDFPMIIRRLIYTTNAIESLNGRYAKAVQLRGHLPSDEAATKLIWLVLRNVAAKWKSPPYWGKVKSQLAIQFQERSNLKPQTSNLKPPLHHSIANCSLIIAH